MIFADVIVDISHENLDKTYQYIVPEELEKKAVIGALVKIPFGRGNRLIQGYIVGLSEVPNWDLKKMKPLQQVVEHGVVIESQLISLAYWMKENYGATINDALKTVIPVKKTVKSVEKKYIKRKRTIEETVAFLEQSKKKNHKGRARLLEVLLEQEQLEYQIVVSKFSIARTTIRDLEQLGYIEIITEHRYRNPIKQIDRNFVPVSLNEEQERIVSAITADYKQNIRKTYLIHGVTGSGKTEVYMSIIEMVLAEGKQVIMLIPEIGLTFQTVMRFYKRFGDRISILHSRLSQGERYDQYLRAKRGEIDIIIGPRSALFTPFPQLGLIIIDEEHEGSYKSESVPKYHARETAIERARMTGSSVILGSATPSIEAYDKALKGEYQLFTMKNRAGKGTLPTVHVVDLREELKSKNRSIFSRKLRKLMQQRLEQKKQIILFINRRGYAGFVSCRSCGYVIKCPHCDISLTYHKDGNLKCHYCGYEVAMLQQCPSCGSPYIAAFGTGTQKIEAMVLKEFPGARVLRMDTDTTKGKDGHEKILSAFANHEADILIGTQMIVKGHDFPEVTLVGILAADLSLYAGNYRSAERTFQLLLQASGRAGRGTDSGEVVIQTYNPEHYSIRTAAKNNYTAFYQEEIAYRKMLDYPPVSHILAILVTSKEEEKAIFSANYLKRAVEEELLLKEKVKLIGPAKAELSKLNDIYRQILYIKSPEYEILKQIKNYLEGLVHYSDAMKKITVQFDFDPMNSY
ncbi:replication restart helicase PriA [Velocimicrobium porci]|uniref:Replication restart protein PriA n=1 Tax=Velocimicrobium porci TaxID=2606634 RepID=A0A6L5XWR8_9FIRM|nr:primosomal protein N' [Velocimicrobium porci]MSS63054.1 primosomal protein N' [Velocimicrobium porci]